MCLLGQAYQGNCEGKAKVNVFAGKYQDLNGPVESLTGIRALTIELKEGAGRVIRSEMEILKLVKKGLLWRDTKEIKLRHRDKEMRALGILYLDKRNKSS